MCNTHSPLIHSDFVAYALEPQTAFGQGTLAGTSHMILWVSFLLSYCIIIWIKTGAISSFFHSDSSHQTICKMKAFQKDKCHQAIVCAGLWVTPSSLSHSPPMWFGSSSDPISSVVEKRKEKKWVIALWQKDSHWTYSSSEKFEPQWSQMPRGSLSLQCVGARADRQTKQHRLHQPSTGDMFKNPTRQKEVAESHWWRGHEGWGRACFLHY